MFGFHGNPPIPQANLLHFFSCRPGNVSGTNLYSDNGSFTMVIQQWQGVGGGITAAQFTMNPGSMYNNGLGQIGQNASFMAAPVAASTYSVWAKLGGLVHPAGTTSAHIFGDAICNASNVSSDNRLVFVLPGQIYRASGETVPAGNIAVVHVAGRPTDANYGNYGLLLTANVLDEMHIVVTSDLSVVGGTDPAVAMYINGQQVSLTTYNNAQSSPRFGNNFPGAANAGVSQLNGRYTAPFYGSIRDFAYYSRILSPQEIQQLYLAGRR